MEGSEVGRCVCDALSAESDDGDEERLRKAACAMVSLAMDRGSLDNISVVAVLLQQSREVAAGK